MDEVIYEEVGRNYRFFLNWRQAALAGFLVIMSALLSLTISILKDFPSLAWLAPAIGSPIGVLFWLIDKRTRALYHAAIYAGQKLEGAKPGFYNQLAKLMAQSESKKQKNQKKNQKTRRTVTQSTVLNIFFLGSTVLLILIAFELFVLTR